MVYEARRHKPRSGACEPCSDAWPDERTALTRCHGWPTAIAKNRSCFGNRPVVDRITKATLRSSASASRWWLEHFVPTEVHVDRVYFFGSCLVLCFANACSSDQANGSAHPASASNP